MAELRNRPLLGVGLMTIGMLMIPVSDSMAKHILGIAPYSPAALAWARFIIGVSVIAPIAWALGAFRDLDPRFFRHQIVRGALIATTIVLIVTGVGKAPLADVFGAFFIGPAVATVLAATLLRERVGRMEWIAVGLGFIGVALVVRPGSSFNPGLAYGLASGVCYGGFLVATRWAAGAARPIAQLAGQLAVGAVLLAPFGAPELAAHGVRAPGWLLATGASSATANLMALLAFRHAPAAYLAPVVYVQILGASAIGWLAFGDTPDRWAGLGLAIIFCAGLTRVPFRRKR